MHELGGGGCAVPLLLPDLHDLPFGMALELVEEGGAPVASTSASVDDGGAYHLHFVLCGRGQLAGGPDEEGPLQTLEAGDSVVWASKQPAAPVVKLKAAAGGPQVQQWGLVVLKVVFPTDIFSQGGRSGLRRSRAVDAAARQWRSGRPVGALGSAVAGQLLAGARAAAKRGLDSAEARSASTPVRRLLGFWRSAVQRHDSALSALEERWQGVLAGSGQRSQAPALSMRHLMEVDTFQLPNQTNLLALVFDPLGEAKLPFTFGIEVFQQNHRTPPHTHTTAHELFFILSGSGIAFCNEQRFEVRAGDTIVFPPGSLHGIDNGPDNKMYLLELMVPNDEFAEFVRQGEQTGLEDEDLCVLIGRGCGSAASLN